LLYEEEYSGVNTVVKDKHMTLWSDHFE